MKAGTKVIVTMGMHKGKKAMVKPKKGTAATKDQLVINLVEGPIIIIPKAFVK